MDDTMSVSRSDLEKICDALEAADSFFELRDAMNAKMHLAPTVRYSPLTSSVNAAHSRLNTILGR